MPGQVRRQMAIAAVSMATIAGASIVTPSAAQASFSAYTLTITTSPSAPGSMAVVRTLSPEGDEWGQSSNTLGAGSGAVGFWADTARTPNYLLAVNPPTEFMDDSAPYLESGPVENGLRTVTFPTPNIRYRVLNDVGSPVSGATVRLERPRYRDGYPAGSTNIVDATVGSSGRFSARLVEGSAPHNAFPGRGWKVVVTPPPGSGLAPLTLDDSFGGLPTLNRDINLRRANIRAVILGPDGQPYQGARVQIETLRGQWCQSQQILSTNVNWDLGTALDDTLMAYTDASISPGGFRITLFPRWGESGEDTSVAQTEFTLPLSWRSETDDTFLQYRAPDLTVTVVGSDGVTPLSRSGVSVTRLKPDGNEDCGQQNAQTSASGKVYFNLDDTGTYRFRVNPPDDSPELAQTFTVPGSSLASGVLSLTMKAANITGTIDDSSGSPLSNARVSFQAYNSQGWLSNGVGETRTNGSGQYRFVLDPSLIPHGVAVTAQAESGWSSGVATQVKVLPNELPWPTGPALVRDITLNPANFAGTILGSEGNPLSQAWVNGNLADGTQLTGVSTNDDGRFAMYVSGTVSTTSPLRLGVWLQDEQRYVQQSVTQLSTDFEWRIPSVNLEVRVVADGVVVPNAQVNLMKFNGAFDEWIAGGQTADNGAARFALDDTTVEYVVEVQPGPDHRNYATTRVTAVPSDQGDGTAAIEVTLDAPNAAVQVVAPFGDEGEMVPLEGAWVWLRGLDEFNGTGSSTGPDGIAKFKLDDTNGLFEVNASAPYQMRNELTSSRLEAEFQSVTGYPLPAIQIPLKIPNLRLMVGRPGTSPTEGLRYAQLEIRRAGEQWGFTWTGTDEQGKAGLNLENGSYDVVVRPSSWEPGMSAFGTSKYSVRLADEGAAVEGPTGIPLEVNDDGYFILEPSVANVTGVVEAPTSPSSPVSNSWVTVMKENTDGTNTWYEWVDGASTSRDGSFGMTLPDDTYVLSAEPVWGDRTYAPSKPCYLIVTGGARLPAGSGVPGQCDDTLTLRAPNLVFTVFNPLTNQPVVGAWACPINTGNWNCVASGRDGKVTFFIDDTASIAGPNIRIQIEAPWGSTGLAGRTISVPKADVGTLAYTDGSRREDLATPNVRIRLWKDDTTSGSEMSEGWVSLVTDDAFFNWIAGAGVSRQGVASFSLDDTSSTFCIDAWPGWSVRNSYGPIQECGVSLASGTLDLVFRSANVKATVLDASGRPNAFGWVEIVGDGPRRGSSLDDRGRLATYLPNGDYTFILYPGWLRTGTPTTVDVQVRGGIARVLREGAWETLAQLSLDSGNVSGRATLSGTPVAGVLVTATGPAGSRKTAVTDDEGRFRISLTPGVTYTLSTLAPPGIAGTVVIDDVAGGTLTGNSLAVGS